MSTCPWCGKDVAPVPTDITVAEFVYSLPRAIRDGSAVRRNPLMCPECHGVGDECDFGWELES